MPEVGPKKRKTGIRKMDEKEYNEREVNVF
jgi:hypothetical protein